MNANKPRATRRADRALTMPVHVCLSLACMLFGLSSGFAAEKEPAFKAGVASRVITPTEPLWMAGYGNRDHPAEGKVHDLHVKAIALEDPKGGRLVLLTSDLVGIPSELSARVGLEFELRTGLSRDRLMLTCSHTHCGPVVRGALTDMYDKMPAEHLKAVDAYTDRLRGLMIDVLVAALADLKPARLAIAKGTARFAVNR